MDKPKKPEIRLENDFPLSKFLDNLVLLSWGLAALFTFHALLIGMCNG